MSDLMTFPATWEEFERSYGFTDKDEVYTNGSRLIQSFRVKQWLEHIQTQTADSVEVVRCKDCRFHEQEQPGMVYCPATVGGWVEENWFCKGGER